MVKKTHLAIGLFVLALIGIPTAVLLSQTSQESRSRASASTTLALLPSTTQSTPLKKTVGDSVSFDIMVDPGTNLPSTVKMEILYDAARFDKQADSLAINKTAFPVTFEGPVITDGKVLISVSIGSDSTKAIQQVTKVGTLTLTTKSASDAATKISFGSRTEVLSLASTDQAAENVLATTSPAYVLIRERIATTATTLSFTAFLHGIGTIGDNANPTASSLSNKEPNHLTRDIHVEVFNDKNALVATRGGSVTYNETSGSYIGTIDFAQTLSQGDYLIKIKEPTHLKRLVDGIVKIVPQKENKIAPVAFVAGDTNNDNSLNILDYNVIAGCYSDLLPAIACDDTKKTISDLNDDGNVNQYDYNLFLREIIVQNGN